MRVIVTGAAGFIGSTLVDHALANGDQVVGIDSFTDYYAVGLKRSNLAGALSNPAFTLVEEDLLDCDLHGLFVEADVVFHLAGQPGVRLSWADRFDLYAQRNITTTHRVLEAAVKANLARVVYGSSSSVYGNAQRYPTHEDDHTEPVSPYGVTKLAAENICSVYASNWDVPTVSLRYFTVYGPRQRPDMAHHRLIRAAIDGTPFPIFGDGSQERSFTYVDDVVRATYLAGVQPDLEPGTVLNVAGPFSYSLARVIEMVGEAVGNEVVLDQRGYQAGDALKTGGDTTAIETALDWRATVDMPEGITAQVEHHLAMLPTH